MPHVSSKMWLGIALLISAGYAHARTPTHAAVAFCNSYAGYVQAELDAYRSGDPAQVIKFQQDLRRDPRASQVLSMGLGWDINTPPWVSDVSGDAKTKCLMAIQADRWMYQPGDPEGPKVEDWSQQRAEHAPEQTPAKVADLLQQREAQVTGSTAPPPDDQFEGTFRFGTGPYVKVLFRRHAAICWGGVIASVSRQGMRPVQTCITRKDPDAYVLRFPRESGFGEERVLYSTMHPVQSAEGSRP